MYVQWTSRHAQQYSNLGSARLQLATPVYAGLGLAWSAGLIWRLQARADVLLYTVLGLGLIFLLGQLVAGFRLRTLWAALQVGPDALRLVTLYDWLNRSSSEEQWFPRGLALPRRHRQGIELSFHDQVVVLRPEDWPDWEQIQLTLRRNPAWTVPPDGDLPNAPEQSPQAGKPQQPAPDEQARSGSYGNRGWTSTSSSGR